MRERNQTAGPSRTAGLIFWTRISLLLDVICKATYLRTASFFGQIHKYAVFSSKSKNRGQLVQNWHILVVTNGNSNICLVKAVLNTHKTENYFSNIFSLYTSINLWQWIKVEKLPSTQLVWEEHFPWLFCRHKMKKKLLPSAMVRILDNPKCCEGVSCALSRGSPKGSSQSWEVCSLFWCQGKYLGLKETITMRKSRCTDYDVNWFLHCPKGLAKTS